MFLFNKVLKLKFISRYREINLFKAKPLLAQEQVFFSLLKKSKDTVWGKRFNYSKIIESDFSKALKEWQDKVPVSNYEKLFPDIEPAINGELNVPLHEKQL